MPAMATGAGEEEEAGNELLRRLATNRVAAAVAAATVPWAVLAPGVWALGVLA